jgi:hypothetical protein
MNTDHLSFPIKVGVYSALTDVFGEVYLTLAFGNLGESVQGDEGVGGNTVFLSILSN